MDSDGFHPLHKQGEPKNPNTTMTERLPRLGRNDFESQIPSSPIEEPEDKFFHDAMEHGPQQREVHQEYQPGDGDNADSVMKHTTQEEEVDQENHSGDLDKIDDGHLPSDGQDSNPSVVTETQLVPLQIETQAESSTSLIGETQYIPLEVDTQAKTQAQEESASGTNPGDHIETRDDVSFRNVDAHAASRTMPGVHQISKHSAAGPIRFPSLLVRPISNDAADAALDFRFSAPPKLAAIRPQPKILQTLFKTKMSEAKESPSATGPGDQIKSIVPQILTSSLPSKPKNDMDSFRSLALEAVPSTSLAATETILPRRQNDTNSIHTLDQEQSTPKHQLSARGPNTTQDSRVKDAAPVTFDSTRNHLLRHQELIPSNKVAITITSNAGSHDSVSQHEPSPDVLSTRIADASVQDQSGPLGQGPHMATKGGRRIPDHHSCQQNLSASTLAMQNNGSSRKKSLIKLSVMPFPEASSRPARHHDRLASDLLKTNSSARLQDSLVPNTSDATCNEKRTRTYGPGTSQAYGGPKEDDIATGSTLPADNRDAPAQHTEPSARPVHRNDSRLLMPTSGIDLQPNNITDLNEHATYRPSHKSQEHPIAVGRPHASHTGNFAVFPLQSGEEAEHVAQSHRNDEFEQRESADEDQDHAIWEPILDNIRRNEHSDPLHSIHAQDISRTLSRVDSEARPDSRRSNRGRPMTRPSRADDLMSRPSTARSCHISMSKVTKSKGPHTRYDSTTVTAPRGARALMGFQQILEMAQEFKDLCRANEDQEKIIASQESSILRLEQLHALSSQRVEALNTENNILTQKTKKFSELSSKYKKHMNEVVNSQEYLKEESIRIQNKLNDALAVESKNRATYENIQMAIKEARDMRDSAEKLQTLNVKLRQQEQKLSNAQKQTKKLGEINERLHQDNNGFKAALDTEKKRIETLQNEFDRQSYELSQESRAKEQLEKQLESQTMIYRELMERMKQLPENVSEQLQKKDGILASILSAGNGTHSRISEMVSLINQWRDDEAKTPAALVQLIEDFSSRLEDREQIADANMTSSKEATTKALEEVKEAVKQLCLYEKSQTQYHDRISRLEKANETLTVDKLARGHETQSLTRQVEELRRELADSQERLTAREGELTEARAIPKDNPRLITKIKELETATSVLESQLDSAKQEVSKAKDEAKFVREVAARKDQQLQGIEQKYIDSQKTIKVFNEERDRYIAATEIQRKTACQELAKKAEALKETMRVKLESQVKNAKQRYQEKESELAQARQKLQELQTQLDSQSSRVVDQDSERATLLREAREHFVRLREAIDRAPSQKTPEEFSKELQSIKVAAKESYVRYDIAKSQLTKIMAGATQEYRRIEDKIEKVGALNVEIQDWKGRCSVYQSQIDELTQTAVRPQQRSVGPESRRESASATLNLPSPAANLYSVQAQMQNDVQTTTRDIHHNAPESMHRSITWNDQHQSSVQSIGTGQLSSRGHGTNTPQARLSLGLSGSKCAIQKDSQQQVPGSQNSGNSIKPFSSLTGFSTPRESDSTRTQNNTYDNRYTGSANVRANFRTSEKSFPTAQLTSQRVCTSSGQTTWANGVLTFQQEPHESNVPLSVVPVSSDLANKRNKSALKHKINPHLAIESSMMATSMRQEVIPKIPRQALGMDNIRGLKSGNVAEASFSTAQDRKQLSSFHTQVQGSPLPGPPNRFQNHKRAHETAEHGPQKRRRSSVQKWPKSSKQ